MTLVSNFESLAAAAESTISTDIPVDMWPAFADLGLRVKGAAISSLAFNNKVFDGGVAGTAGNANFAEIHRLVQEALDPPPDLSSTIEASSEAGSAEEPRDRDAEASEPETDPDDATGDHDEPADELDTTRAADITATC
jgi:hypothetical protein